MGGPVLIFSNILHLRNMEPSRRLPVWWHKMDGAGSVSYGTVNPVFHNTNFSGSNPKHGNHLIIHEQAGSVPENGPSFYIPSGDVYDDRFSIEFWLYNSGIVNGWPDFECLISYHNFLSNPDDRYFYLRLHDGVDLISDFGGTPVFTLVSKMNGNSPLKMSWGDGAPTQYTYLPLSQWSHIKLIKTESDTGTDFYELWINGVKQTPFYNFSSNQDVVTPALIPEAIVIGGMFEPFGTDPVDYSEYTQRKKGRIDNIKIFNYVKRDTDDREKEGENIPAGYTPPVYIPPSTAVAWYKLEDETAEIGPDLTIVGTPVYAAAKYNNGIDVDSSNYLKLPAAVWKKDVCTIEFWVKIQSTSPDTYAAMIGDDVIDGRLDIFNGGDGNLYFRIQNYSKRVPLATVFSGVGDLHHIAISWDQYDGTEAGSRRAWVDGVEYQNSTGYGPITIGTDGTSNPLKIGWKPGSNATPIIIDNLKVYDSVKTDFSDRFSE